MSEDQFLVLASMFRTMIRSQVLVEAEIRSLKDEVNALKNELARLHQVGESVDCKLEQLNKVGKKIEKKL